MFPSFQDTSVMADSWLHPVAAGFSKGEGVQHLSQPQFIAGNFQEII